MGLKHVKGKTDDGYIYTYIVHTIFGFIWIKRLVEVEWPDGTIQRFI